MSNGAAKTIVLFGAGRMVQAIAEALKGRPEFTVCAIVSPRLPAWEAGVPHYSSLDAIAVKADVLIDFSLAEGTLDAARWCGQNGVALLSGVTGLDEPAKRALRQAGDSCAVLWSANLSLGVNMLAQLCALAAASMPAETQVLIQDVHHQWKKDAPSGTALMLGAALTSGLSGDLPSVEYRSVREGETIGDHQVIFQWAGERLVLSHEAQDRSLFATGALDAANWLCDQPAGLYKASDWLAGRAIPSKA